MKRGMRTIATTIASYISIKNKKSSQLIFDGISRSQVSMILLSVDIAESGSPDLVRIILSCSRLSLDETSEVAASNIESMLDEGKSI